MTDLINKIVRQIILENLTGEKRQLSAKSRERVNKVIDDHARKIYGDQYGTLNKAQTDFYFPKGDAEITKDLNIKSGMFAVGNEKLSDDTLIINFTSALGCPSINDCPISQKACYAVAGENRLKDARRKNIKVQNAALKSWASGMLDGFFKIAEEYVKEYDKTNKKVKNPETGKTESVKNGIKYIRFNEVGDFPNQDFLDMAAKFAYKMKKEYGIKSMAYTAKTKIDPSKEIEVEKNVFLPIDTIIAMNRSRSDIKISKDGLDRNFYGIEMPRSGFSVNPDVNLEHAYSDVAEVTDTLANKLQVIMPEKDETGDPCIPILRYGSWNGGSGYYYVCPCSFWKYNKMKAADEFLKSINFNGKVINFYDKLGDASNYLNAEKESLLSISGDEETVKTNSRKAGIITKAINALKNIDSYPDNNNGVAAVNKAISILEQNGVLPPNTKKDLDKVLSKINSPCGIKCSVCHDTQGGKTTDGQIVKKYTILTATHGGTASNYNSDYANAKREGNDDVKYSEDNPHGYWTVYGDIQKAKKTGKKLSKDEMDDIIKGESIAEKVVIREGKIKKEIINENKNNFFKILENITKTK